MRKHTLSAICQHVVCFSRAPLTLSCYSSALTGRPCRGRARGRVSAAVLRGERRPPGGEEHPRSHGPGAPRAPRAEGSGPCRVLVIHQAGRVVVHPPVGAELGSRGGSLWRGGRGRFRLDRGRGRCRRWGPLLFGVLSLCGFLLLLQAKQLHINLTTQNSTLIRWIKTSHFRKPTWCASLAAAAARPVSTDATLAPSLAGLSCFGRVGNTRAANGK
jgi:hypothetical protein